MSQPLDSSKTRAREETPFDEGEIDRVAARLLVSDQPRSVWAAKSETVRNVYRTAALKALRAVCGDDDD